MSRVASTALALTAALAAALPAAAPAAQAGERPRLRALEDAKTRASIPFPVDLGGEECIPGVPTILSGDTFDPGLVDQLDVWRDGSIVAWTTTLSELGIPGTTRDVVVFREGRTERVRLSDAAGDNDQPTVGSDIQGMRVAWRGSDGARGTTTGNIYLRTTTRKKNVPGGGGDGETDGETGGGAGGAVGGYTETSETIKVTALVATTTDPKFGTAYDPSLCARRRARDAGSGVKVRERDARIAFVSTGDLEKGRNADHLPQLFLWRERAADFVQLTSISLPGSQVNRPSIDASASRIAFECTADLTPGAVDPKDPSRVGNPDGVRQIYLWRQERGIEQITWSDRPCFAPRIGRNGAFVTFSSQGELITGGNPERNSEIYVWVDVRDPSRRLRQVTRTAAGDSVLPRPGDTSSVIAFWSTASPPDDGSGFGTGPKQCGPLPYVHRSGRFVRVGGLTDVENALRIADSPDPDSPENPILAGPPCPGRDHRKVQFVTNDTRLNARGADDDLDGSDDDVEVDASILSLHVGRSTTWR